MPEDANEPLADCGRLVGFYQFLLSLSPLVVRFEFECDQVGQQLEDLEVLVFQRRSDRVKRAERAKVAAIPAVQGDRDVTLDAEPRESGVVRETWIGARLVDDERCDRTADDASVRRR